LDIATGLTKVTSGYRTVGSPESTYREGNSTIQFSTVNKTATYNTTTNEPNRLSRKGKIVDRGTNQGQWGKIIKPSRSFDETL